MRNGTASPNKIMIDVKEPSGKKESINRDNSHLNCSLMKYEINSRYEFEYTRIAISSLCTLINNKDFIDR